MRRGGKRGKKKFTCLHMACGVEMEPQSDGQGVDCTPNTPLLTDNNNNNNNNNIDKTDPLSSFLEFKSPFYQISVGSSALAFFFVLFLDLVPPPPPPSASSL